MAAGKLAHPLLGESHTRRDLHSPQRWSMFVSNHNGRVRRLVVFIHGFLGKPVSTWLDFPRVDAEDPENIWWLESDLLFIGYSSVKDDITGVANRIRQNLNHFYPTPLLSAMMAGDVAARSDIESLYNELVIVGHSLGGLILRRALCDAAQKWIDEGRVETSRPILLDAKNRMFSPASAGFRAAGMLGVVRAVPVWSAVEMFLRRASAFTDLQPDSIVLREIRDRTLRLHPDSDTSLIALRANIVWASPDDVVIAERYSTDFVEWSCDGTTHSSVCKPHSPGFDMPWTFVRTGVVT